MVILKKIGRVALSVLAGALALVLLVCIIFNSLKFAIYYDYYSMKSDLCDNPGLNDGFVCQGIAAVDGRDLILVSGYMTGKAASRVYVTDLNSKSYYVELNRDGKDYTGHAGGIATVGDRVYIANGSKIFDFPLDDLLTAKPGDSVNIGQGTEINNKASFIFSDDEYLYVGSFMDESTDRVEEHIFNTAEGEHTAICTLYSVDDLTTPVRVYSIRDYVQGVCVTENGEMILSTSHGLASSVYYVYDLDRATDSGKSLDGAPVYYLENLKYEVWGPAMSEGLDVYGGGVITLTESASNKYIFGKFFFANYIVKLDFNK